MATNDTKVVPFKDNSINGIIIFQPAVFLLVPFRGNPSLTALPFLNPLSKFPFLNKVLYLRTFALPLSSL